MDIPEICILKFQATWCGPCKDISSYIDELKKLYPSIPVLSIDADENQSLCQKYNVTKLPTFIFQTKNYKRVIIGTDKQILKLEFSKINDFVISNQIQNFPQDQSARVNVPIKKT